MPRPRTLSNGRHRWNRIRYTPDDALIENEFGIAALARLAEEFKLRAAVEHDFRAATYYLALETLRVRWEAGAWVAETIETGSGDRR